MAIDVLTQIASATDRRDEVPNQQLAAKIVAAKDADAVAQLVQHLNHKNKDIQNDCIKVLYETGEAAPTLIAPYLQDFLNLLQHKNNRLQWGAMTAIKCIAKTEPEKVYQHLPAIMQGAEKGSVITRDNAVYTLVNLASVKQYADDVFALLKELLLNSPANQLPMYAEQIQPIVQPHQKAILIATLQDRLKDVEKESKQKRIQKVIQKLEK